MWTHGMPMCLWGFILLSSWSQTSRLLTSVAVLFRGDLVEEKAAEALRREDIQLIKRVLVPLLVKNQVKIVFGPNIKQYLSIKGKPKESNQRTFCKHPSLAMWWLQHFLEILSLFSPRTSSHLSYSTQQDQIFHRSSQNMLSHLHNNWTGKKLDKAFELKLRFSSTITWL